jgi:hypothetical protein
VPYSLTGVNVAHCFFERCMMALRAYGGQIVPVSANSAEYRCIVYFQVCPVTTEQIFLMEGIVTIAFAHVLL